MFCVSCGKRLEPGMRFCPSCGAVVEPGMGGGGAAVPPPLPTGAGYGGGARAPRTATLVRPREGRVIGGVCAAFALRYGWDVMLVRILFGVVTLLTAVAIGVGAYLVAWLVIPEAPTPLPHMSR